MTADAGQQPLVTVAIPTYRRPDWLRVAVESALAQTYRNLEIIVSDSDGSDEVAALVAGYGDPRLRYRRNATPTSGLENYLAMVREASGEFLATLHDDDKWEPGFIEAQVTPMIADPEVVVSFGDHWVTDEDLTVLPEQTEQWTRDRGRAGLAPGRHQPFAELAIADRAVFMVVATVIRTGTIDWADVVPEAAPPFDVWMAYLASRRGGAAWYEPRRLTHYRLHGASDSHTERLEAPMVRNYEVALADPRLVDIRPALSRAVAFWRASLGLSLLALGDRSQLGTARRSLLQAAKDGEQVRGLLGLGLSVLPAGIRVWAISELRSRAARRRVQH